MINAAPCEITHVMEITADYRTGFTDKMRIKYRMRYIVQPYFYHTCLKPKSDTVHLWGQYNLGEKNKFLFSKDGIN